MGSEDMGREGSQAMEGMFQSQLPLGPQDKGVNSGVVPPNQPKDKGLMIFVYHLPLSIGCGLLPWMSIL